MPADVLLSDLGHLPATLDGRQTAELYGISYWTLLERRKAGDLPVQPLSFGRALRWPTAAVLRSIGITEWEPRNDEGPAATAGPIATSTTPDVTTNRKDSSDATPCHRHQDRTLRAVPSTGAPDRHAG